MVMPNTLPRLQTCILVHSHLSINSEESNDGFWFRFTASPYGVAESSIKQPCSNKTIKSDKMDKFTLFQACQHKLSRPSPSQQYPIDPFHRFQTFLAVLVWSIPYSQSDLTSADASHCDDAGISPVSKYIVCFHPQNCQYFIALLASIDRPRDH